MVMVIRFLHSQSYKFTEYISLRLKQILFLHGNCGIYMYIFQHNLANTLQQKGSDDNSCLCLCIAHYLSARLTKPLPAFKFM